MGSTAGDAKKPSPGGDGKGRKESGGKKNGQPEGKAGAYLPEDAVHLKPFLGIKPGHYLAGIYGAALLLILFFALFYPGLSNPGTLVTVKSEPWGAAVLVDGVYQEAAPCEIPVPAGYRRIELNLPGFVPKKIDIDIRGKLFASALFPLRVEIKEKLEPENPAAAFTESASEYAAWSFTGEPGAAYQIPLSLSEGAYRLGPAASDPAVRESFDGTIAAAARFAVTRAGIRDLLRAKTLADNNGLSPSPLSLLASAGDITGFLNGNPGAAVWLGAVLDGGAQAALTASSWYAGAAADGEQVQGFPLFEGDSVQNTRAGGLIQAGGLNFLMIPGGYPLLGGNFPAGTSPEDFYISGTTVSAPAWEAFLEANPKWKPENAGPLIEEGLLSGAYQAADGFPGSPAGGVSGITWYAARAFCEWLSASLPPRYASWEVRLPTEAEWEYAAKAGALDVPETAGSEAGGSGRFWEWCGDPYAPLGFLPSPPAAAAALGSPERSLKGGSWVNTPGAVGYGTRASLPPSYSSPFVSFRPVIARKGGR